jgi:hypothetical protein
MIAALALAIPAQASAESTVCSNPSRAKVLSSAVVKLPTGGIDELEKAFEGLSESIGMTTWAVAGSDKDGKGTVTKSIGLQSPQASVGITARWKIGDGSVKLVVERTCFTDDLEPWSDYWSKLISGLNAKEFLIKS